MNEYERRQWLRFSGIWRNVLTKVLDWPSDQTEAFIQAMHEELMRTLASPRPTQSFFFDSPTDFLVRPIMDNRLLDRASELTGGNPHAVFMRVTDAICGGTGGTYYELEELGFNWTKARERYRQCLEEIESELAELDKKKEKS